MDSLPILQVPGETDSLSATWSWMDAIEEVPYENKFIKILFKECDQYPDVPYVQLPSKVSFPTRGHAQY